MPYESPFSAVIALGRRNRMLLTETETVDNPGGTRAVAQFSFNAAFFGTGASFLLSAVMSTSKGSITGSVQLYNVTDGEAVTNGLLQTSSTSPTALFEVLTVGSSAGDLKDTQKIYEIRMSVSGSDATDILSVGSVRMEVL